jgi:L-lactate dehydrogenase (cytochrome)
LRFKKFEPNGTKRRLAGAYTIADLRRIAKRRTPSGPFDYVDGSAEEEITINKVKQYFRDVEFQPRLFKDVSQSKLTTEVFGREYRLPFGFAPTGFTRMMHHEGEKAVVRAARRHGIPYALSTVGTTSISALAAEAPDAHRWFQLYLWKDRERSKSFIETAKQNGYQALVLTMDVPAAGNRLRDLRNGMTIPPQLTLKTLIDASYRPNWWFNFLTTEPLKFGFSEENTGVAADIAGQLYDPAVTLDDIGWIRDLWDGPLIVKGVQTLKDAQLIVDAGADGIVVSNHGGRQLDRAPIPLRILPDIVDAVGDRATVMMDTGITTGADIVAALAAGADFVWVGRAYLYGLMAGGEAGVNRVVEILESEVVRTMKLLGVQSIEELSREHIRLSGM